ncbi:MAG: RIP metalloprotease [Candidatus Dojkabacteria bacterium]
MEFVLSIAIFFLLLGLLIFVHELGHFLAAKWSGVVVQEFAFGFGPLLFAKRFKGTEYQLRLFPLGGFVKMLGDQDATSFSRYTAKKYARSDKRYALKVLKEAGIDPVKDPFSKVENFVKDAGKELEKDDFIKLNNYYAFEYIPSHPGNYDNKRTRSRIIINVAGVVMNFFLGALIFYLLFQFTNYTSDLIKIGTPPLIGVETSSPPAIFKVYTESNADLEGGVILMANGETVTSEDEFIALVEANENQSVEIEVFTQNGYVRRPVVLSGDGVQTNFDSDVRDKIIVLSVQDDSAASAAGLEADSVIIAFNGEELETTDRMLELLDSNRGQEVELGYYDSNGDLQTAVTQLPDPAEGEPILGASLASNDPFYRGAVRVSYQNNKLLSGLLHALNTGAYTLTGLGELIGQSIAQRSLQPVSQGVSSIVGVADIIYSLVQIDDFLNILNFTGLISITLAVMNILPIPLLDGGNLVFILLEKFRGRPLSEKKQEIISRYTFYILIVLFLLVIVKDVFQFDWPGRILGLIRGIFGG